MEHTGGSSISSREVSEETTEQHKSERMIIGGRRWKKMVDRHAAENTRRWAEAAEQRKEESSRSRESQSRLVGYFFQRRPESKKSPHRFVPTCSRGERLDLDESLGFIKEVVRIVSSSNGLLLCTTLAEENMQYIICNPVTREFRKIPPPHRSYPYASAAFICHGDIARSSIEMIEFDIYRLGVAADNQLDCVLWLEIFSSKTGLWEKSPSNCKMPFKFDGVYQPGLLLKKQVVIWKSQYDHDIITYVISKKLLKVTHYPNIIHNQGRLARAEILDASNGKLYFAFSSHRFLGVWYYNVNKWTLKHVVSYKEMINQNPDLDEVHKLGLAKRIVDVVSVHPYNSELVMVAIQGILFWYDIETGKLKNIGSRKFFKNVCFPYEWPCTTLDDDPNLLACHNGSKDGVLQNGENLEANHNRSNSVIKKGKSLSKRNGLEDYVLDYNFWSDHNGAEDGVLDVRDLSLWIKRWCSFRLPKPLMRSLLKINR